MPPFLTEAIQLALLVLVAPLLFLIAFFKAISAFYRAYKLKFTHPSIRPGMNVIITGASRGLGRALALRYAELGVKFLGISGRDETELAKVRDECLRRGAENVEIKPIDVRDKEEMRRWIEGVNKTYPLNLVIANAGTTSRQSRLERREAEKEESGEKGDFEKRVGEFCQNVEDIVNTNIVGVINTVLPAASAMLNTPNSYTEWRQIGIVSSVASFANVDTYCASKAFSRTFAEALRLELEPHGIKVNAICPGTINTRMTQHLKKKPLSMSPEMAAERTIEGLVDDKLIISFPFIVHLGLWMWSTIPFAVQKVVSSHLQLDVLDSDWFAE